MASEIPVLPEVGSRMVCPGAMAPFSSASLISALATRSLTEPVGLRDSSLAQMRTPGLAKGAATQRAACCRSTAPLVAIATPARLVPQAFNGHYFTEYSGVWQGMANLSFDGTSLPRQ